MELHEVCELYFLCTYKIFFIVYSHISLFFSFLFQSGTIMDSKSEAYIEKIGSGSGKTHKRN